ncbi:hypothetical protein HNQ80_000747 [Anaerosolibacter carboniphilus]|uniref:Spo0E like sporulation regulatory protein n=1 Tax=Anaerosolibacter carboniphilus TaxID=1417629 RepID=A0A841KLF0_9FIRM|nr:aspartyl-phosphate phosphatase Spo0E family protein [Anaerosolibacter carboniphilus]MBB6214664.1 hypothetical protein [Anaerosolibacter carboniphilus]
MCELQKLLEDIEKLRTILYELIEKKGIDLQDPEVIASSQTLNAAIAKYNEMIRKKI